MIRLFVVDLDGTLLHSQGMLTPESLDAIQRCTRAGIKVIMATARPPRSSRLFYEQLRLTTPSIHYNGALICDLTAGQVILHRPIPGDLARELHDAALQIDPAAVISLEVCDKWYINRRMTAFKTETERIGFKPDYVGDLHRFFNEPVTKVLISFPTTGSHVASQKLQDVFNGRLSFTKSEEGIVQIMNGGVSKGTAVRFLMERFGITRDEAAAAGDAPNDISMFEAVGLSIAMANAYPETKAAATRVTLDHDENGVAVAIEKWILGK